MEAVQKATAYVGFWEGVLGYRQSILTVLTSLALGMFFHWKVGYRFALTPEAFLLFVTIAVLVIVCVARRFSDDRVVNWLLGIPFAIVSVTAVSLLAFLGGVVPESTFQRFGFPSVFASWPFLFVCSQMLLSLIGSTARRAWPLNRANVQYMLSHGGLAIALLGGAYGALSLERLNLVLYEGVPTAYAFDAREQRVKLPFVATLREFKMERFAPTLAVATLDPKAEDGVTVTPGSAFVRQGLTENIGPLRVVVKRYLPQAAFTGQAWVSYPMKTSAPAAFVAVSKGSNLLKQGWISSGGIESPRTALSIDEGTALVMHDPSPKRFLSLLTIDGRPVTVEVNQPVTIGDRTLYQLSYDEKMGPASAYSVIEIVQDRSIPVVFSGLFMLLAGAAMVMWRGVGPTSKASQVEPAKGGTK